MDQVLLTMLPFIGLLEIRKHAVMFKHKFPHNESNPWKQYAFLEQNYGQWGLGVSELIKGPEI